MDYYCLTEMRAVASIDSPEPLGQPTAAPRLPATGPTHAVREKDDTVVCGYDRQPSDTEDRNQDWMSLHPGERCARCAEVLHVDGWLS